MPDDKKESTEDQVTLNEQTMTQAEFEDRKKDLESKPGVSVIETGKDRFRSRIKG